MEKQMSKRQSQILARIRRNLKPITPQEREVRWARVKAIRERSTTLNPTTSLTVKTTVGEAE